MSKRNLEKEMIDRLKKEAPLGGSMGAKLKRAKTFDTLANESELIRLEALARISDSLEDIAEHFKREDRNSMVR